MWQEFKRDLRTARALFVWSDWSIAVAVVLFLSSPLAVWGFK